MEKNKNEIRTIDCCLAIREAVDNQAEEPSRTVTGKAIAFNSESEVLDDWGMRFREIIKPEACTAEWLATQDVKMNLLHDRTMTLARCNKGEGSMKMEVREDGVYFEFEAPKCDLGDQVLELVRNKTYTGCSFEFYPQDYEIEERNNGEEVTITHTKFRAVTSLTIGLDPAYQATSVNARELGATTATENREADEAAQQAEAERKLRDRQRLATRMGHEIETLEFYSNNSL